MIAVAADELENLHESLPLALVDVVAQKTRVRACDVLEVDAGAVHHLIGLAVGRSKCVVPHFTARPNPFVRPGQLELELDDPIVPAKL